MKLDGRIVVWPANLDSTKTRLQGRKLPKGQSVQTPRLDELAEAARRLSIQAEVTPQKSRPKNWWERTGYIIVPKSPRTELLRSLASEVRRIRAAKDQSKR